MAQADVCSQCGAPLEEQARCRFCGARRAAGPDTGADVEPAPSPAVQAATRAAQRSAMRAFTGVWWIVTVVGLGIIVSGGLLTAEAFGPLPALAFAGIGVAWLLIARAGRSVAQAQRAALEAADDEA